MTMAATLATTEDAFIGGRLTLLQARDGHRAGLDAVLLAAAVAGEAGERVLEAGSGPGVVSLLVACRVPGVTVLGIEIEPDLVALAQENARRNGLAEHARFVVGDVTSGAAALRGAEAEPGTFDHVIANPPFVATGQGRLPATALKRRASTMPTEGLDHWLRFLASACRPGGQLTLIHRADALARLLQAIEGRFGGIGIFPLFPRPGEPALRVIVTGTKGSRAALTLQRGLVLHEVEGNRFTVATQAVLRDGAPLALAAGQSRKSSAFEL